MTILYSDGTQEPAPPDEPQFILQLTLINNTDNSEVLSYDFPYTDIQDMNMFTLSLFILVAFNIPEEENPVISVITAPENDAWRNKWLYVRASVDCPVTIYELKRDDPTLYRGQAMYAGSDIENPDRAAPLDHKYVAMPGLTVGAEAQFLNWMSGELYFQFSMDLGNPPEYGDLAANYFMNIAMGLELKFPVKLLKHFMIEPYGAVSYQFNSSPAFEYFPQFAAGGGLQVGAKGSANGAFFVDVNYMHTFEDALYKNAYPGYFPNPEFIHFQRNVIGIKAGYKYGFFDRNK